jgi:D-glycero-D-manno-heptose 1,7-bisphosphate phosphatase
MAAQHQISGWIQNDQYHSISDPERWKETEEYLKDKKIILIDRDGVINKKAPQGEYITKWEEFRWIPETRTAMKLLAKEGFRFIVISNQAGVARGMVDQNELNCIHKKMKDELLNESIQIIDIYVCPHHWNEGCSCRKPKPGMMLQASREHLLRLDKTLFIGDDIRDCQTAENAGCESIFVGKATVLATLPTKEHPICHSPLLTDCLPIITEYFHQ